MNPSAPVGFFDSGVGGLCVRDAFARRLPHENTVYLADGAHGPYGARPAAEIAALARGHVRTLLARGCKMIVVACNTATAAAIDALRAEWPDVPFVGMEPAVKPAVLNSKSGVVGVLATQGTFNGRLYRETCARFAGGVTVLTCVADEFVTLVERGETDGPAAEAAVRARIEPLLAAGADHLVLGCTHFPHLMKLIEKTAAGRAAVLDPSDAVARQAARVLETRGLLNPSSAPGAHEVVRTRRARGLALLSGGLDSQLAVCVLRDAGADMEGVTFATPFFSPVAARKAAAALGLPLHVVDFTDDEIALIENPPHGFGGAMNPCIDCHATMIRRAGEMMTRLGFDFVSTGEVLNQRPMSQNRQSLGVVERSSGLAGRLVRPLCAQLLEPTIPETEGLLDRSKLLGLSGRRREPQFELAKKYGLTDYPSPAGGCKLTEKGFGRKLKDLLEHEGLRERRLVNLLGTARRFRLPGGTGVLLGRDAAENDALAAARTASDTLLAPVSVPGPTALIPAVRSADDLGLAARLVCAWSRCDRFDGDVTVKVLAGETAAERIVPRPYSRDDFLLFQIT